VFFRALVKLRRSLAIQIPIEIRGWVPPIQRNLKSTYLLMISSFILVGFLLCNGSAISAELLVGKLSSARSEIRAFSNSGHSGEGQKFCLVPDENPEIKYSEKSTRDGYKLSMNT